MELSEACGEVDVLMDRANGVDRHFWKRVSSVLRGGDEWRTAQRVARASGRVASRLNWCETPRIGADIRVEAMPGVVGWQVRRCRRRMQDDAPRPRFLTFSCRAAAHHHTPAPPPPAAMASVTPAARQFSTCLRCVRQLSGANGTPRRFLSSSAVAREEVQPQTSKPAPPAPPPSDDATLTSPKTSEVVEDYMKKWGTLDPQTVENKKQERRLLRREHVQPVGSRRRRATLRRSGLKQAVEVPFEQLPYQCFQEARKILLEDRQEKIKAIETQQSRIKNLMEQDVALSGGQLAKETRLRSMRKYLNELVILADINDPAVKRKFEDGQGRRSECLWFRTG
jgi:hypothetical protein